MLCFVVGHLCSKYGVFEGIGVDVKEDFVEIGDRELPDDDSVQSGSKFCVIFNELATEQQ